MGAARGAGDGRERGATGEKWVAGEPCGEWGYGGRVFWVRRGMVGAVAGGLAALS